MSRSSSKGIEQKECPLCSKVKSEFRFMVLINCRHAVCRSCLRSNITYCRSSGLRCPVVECDQLLEEAEMRDILEHTRSSVEPAPVANHWNWSSKGEAKKSPRIKAEHSNYFPEKDFPKLPPPSSMTTMKDTRSYKCSNIMDDPVPSELRSYESFKSSKEETTQEIPDKKHSDEKYWNPTSRTRLRELIADKMHKEVDFVFVTTEADISLNMNPVECLICQVHIKTFEGVSFPFCSSYFCRTCLAQPDSRASDVILLYSDSTNESKKCAVIIDGEMRSFFQKSTSVPTNTVRSLVSIYENVDRSMPSGNEQISIDSDSPLISRDVKSNKANGQSPQLDTMSDVVLLRNRNPSSCKLCEKFIGTMKGVILRNCYHVLCENCLIKTILVTLETTGVEVRCPMMLENHRRCETIVQEREIKSLLTAKQYEVYERKCLEAAVDEFSTRVHCLKPTCTGWIIVEGYKESFVCPVCSSDSCLSCKVIHQGKTCSTYKSELRLKRDKDLSLKTKLMALDAQQKVRCPSCRSDSLNPPRCNFIRCKDCSHVFSVKNPDSKM